MFIVCICIILSTFILRWNKNRQEWIVVEKVWNARRSNGMEWNDVTLLRSPMWSFLACTYVCPDMTGSRCVIMAIVRKLHLKKITCNIFLRYSSSPEIINASHFFSLFRLYLLFDKRNATVPLDKFNFSYTKTDFQLTQNGKPQRISTHSNVLVHAHFLRFSFNEKKNIIVHTLSSHREPIARAHTRSSTKDKRSK